MATEYVMRMLGLDVCADTPVGNEMVRGISGGQKKRVTTGEMIVSSKKVRAPQRMAWAMCRGLCRMLADLPHVALQDTLGHAPTVTAHTFGDLVRCIGVTATKRVVTNALQALHVRDCWHPGSATG